MSDCYVYTSKGYKPVQPDWAEPTPLWVMIVEVLRDFPAPLQRSNLALRSSMERMCRSMY